MALLTAESISRLAVALLRRSIVLPATVIRAPGEEYGGPNGATVSVRVRVPRTAKTQDTPGAAIDYSDIAETDVAVTLTHLYDATHLTDEDLALNLESFGLQVLEPMVAAIAEGGEEQVAAVFNDQLADGEFASTASEADTIANILEGRAALTTYGVPPGRRTMACAPDILNRVLSVPTIVRADTSGSTSALQAASPGMVYGFRVVESPALDPGTAVLYHESAVAWANRAPAKPTSVDAAITTEQGISLRTVRAFDVTHLREAVAVSTFAGAGLITDDTDESGDDGIRRLWKIEIGS